jgi:hypothetical protein
MAGKATNVPTFHFGKTHIYRGDQITGCSFIPAQVVLTLANGEQVRMTAADELKDYNTQRAALTKWMESNEQRSLPLTRAAGAGESA